MKPAPVSDVVTEARWAASGWPEACWNMLHRPVVFGTARVGDAPVGDAPGGGDAWRGRRALPDCSDAPVLRGFVPLGEFLRRFDRPVNREQAAGYLERLSVEHVDVEPFITRGLGGRVPKAVLDARRAKAKEEKADANDAPNAQATPLPGCPTPPVCDADGDAPTGRTPSNGPGECAGYPSSSGGSMRFGPRARCTLTKTGTSAPDGRHERPKRRRVRRHALVRRVLRRRDVRVARARGLRRLRLRSRGWLTPPAARRRPREVSKGGGVYVSLPLSPPLSFFSNWNTHMRVWALVDEADAWFASQLRAKDTPATRAARVARDREEESLRRAAGAPRRRRRAAGVRCVGPTRSSRLKFRFRRGTAPEPPRHRPRSSPCAGSSPTNGARGWRSSRRRATATSAPTWRCSEIAPSGGEFACTGPTSAIASGASCRVSTGRRGSTRSSTTTGTWNPRFGCGARWCTSGCRRTRGRIGRRRRERRGEGKSPPPGPGPMPMLTPPPGPGPTPTPPPTPMSMLTPPPTPTPLRSGRTSPRRRRRSPLLSRHARSEELEEARID